MHCVTDKHHFSQKIKLIVSENGAYQGIKLNIDNVMRKGL